MQVATLTPPPAAGRPTPSPTAHPDPAAVKVPPATAAPRLLVSMATYNELGNLEPLIREVHQYAPDAHILVVDDNSPDGTGRRADELAAADPRIHVLHRPGKLGLGTAILAAMRYAIDHDYDYLLNVDADFSHPPRFIPGLLAGMDRHDVMVGSRYVKGGGTENWPVSRLVISRAVNMLVRFLFRMPVKDASGAFRCYRVSKLKEADLGRTQSRGYSFQQEVLFRVHRTGAKLGELPFVFENRREGKSKVNPAEAVRSIGMILWIGTHYFFGLEKYGRRKPAQIPDPVVA